jgi:hypothetical protein
VFRVAGDLSFSGSMLLRPHTLRECALDAGRPGALNTLADLDDESLEDMLSILNKEAKARKRSKRPLLAASQPCTFQNTFYCFKK